MKAVARSARAWPAWLTEPSFEFALLLLVLTLAAYIPAIMGGYIWDDDAFVTDNAVLRAGVHGLYRIWFVYGATDQYYPMAYTSFWLEYQVWGYWAAGSHLVNAILHGLNALLLWKALRTIKVPGAWLAAFIFALHPVEVESVAWITERKNVLSTSFYLLAALAYFRFQPPGASTLRRAWRFYVLAILLFFCALWSKTVTCTLPGALLLVLWWKKDRLTPADILPVAPLLVIGAAMGLLTGWMEKHVIGAKGNDWSLTLAQRFLIAGRAPWFYLSKLLWPHPLIFFYPRWNLDSAQWWQWLFPGGLAAAFLLLWFTRDRIGKAPLAAAAFFVMTLFPALGFIDVYPFRYSFVADHFQYLASVGPIALAASGVTHACSLLWERRRWAANTIRALIPAILLVYSALTWRQGLMYADLETFYRTILAANPGCWMAYDNLSVRRLGTGQTDESISLSTQALRIKPDDPEANVNLGNALMLKGSPAEAEAHFRTALAARPDFPEAHSDLGNLLLFTGRRDAAIAEYQLALKQRGNYPEGHNNLGYAYLQQHQLDKAIAEFNSAIALRPDYVQARENLQNALAQKASNPSSSKK